MQDWFVYAQWHEVAIAGWLYFQTIYFAAALLNLSATRIVLPAMRHGGILDPRAIPRDQLRRELTLSQLSIALFGVGILFPWTLIRLGWAAFAQSPSSWRIALEIVALIAWNEVHFYINHRLLHTRWLRSFHTAHHRSMVTTPWATYSFHPVEALMLGNVLIFPMLVHDFSFVALLCLPIFSIVFNSIGHSNYDFLPDFHKDRWWLNGSRRHHLHHACFNGNYGFMLPFMDRLGGTTLPADSINIRLSR